MNRRPRRLLAAALALGLAASGRGEDAKKLETTPQVKAYRALLEAIQAGDYAAYKRCMVKEAGPRMDAQTKEAGKTPREVLEFMAMITPAEVAVTDLRVDGKKATLHATGPLGGEMNYATVELTEEDGEWKIDRQSWSAHKAGGAPGTVTA